MPYGDSKKMTTAVTRPNVAVSFGVQFRFLGNCPPTPLLKPTLTLGEKSVNVGLGVGRQFHRRLK